MGYYRAKLRIFVSHQWQVEADFLLATFFFKVRNDKHNGMLYKFLYGLVAI